jgi:hypothetical protein
MRAVHFYNLLELEALTAVVMNTIFWDITPCSRLKVNWRFGGTYHLHLQGRRISRARNQREIRCEADSTLKMEAICSSKRQLTQRTTVRYIPENSVLSQCCLVDLPHDVAWTHLTFCAMNC